jgi:predicted metal-binding transcription factor (methanogenesis marker protein 9)
LYFIKTRIIEDVILKRIEISEENYARYKEKQNSQRHLREAIKASRDLDEKIKEETGDNNMNYLKSLK